MKKITVIVRNLPMNTRRNAEALRMSVGLTLCGDKVTVVFMDDGVYSTAPAKPELIGPSSTKKDFEVFAMLKCTLLADKPSLEKRAIKNPVPNVKIAERDEIVRMITESDIVIPF
ncbi:MAG: DsrE family protein [Euryarchaeota archaeon]|nr:DsrE family protein [Euryarchaeota archaeon]MBU4221331.1 DsrE family protein [Euryarchaeota archaeon]MBU4339721.1 DsrE family protein [Euryarchaeota archaeon]MBU4453468.1 DsrE family protein [Euryarchaeota archaeon]